MNGVEGLSYNDITEENMLALAESIEDYVDTISDILILPKDTYNPKSKAVKEALTVVEDLVRRLRKGDKESIFKDDDY